MMSPFNHVAGGLLKMTMLSVTHASRMPRELDMEGTPRQLVLQESGIILYVMMGRMAAERRVDCRALPQETP